MNTLQKFYKITYIRDNGEDFNCLDNTTYGQIGSSLPGGLYFTDVKYIFKFLGFGNYLREVTLPTMDNDFKYVAEGKNMWRANKLIFGNKYYLFNVETFKYLISLGANYLNDNYDSLQWVAEHGYLDLVEYLISLEGLNNDQSAYKYAIYAATKNNNFHIIKLLIDKGANIHKIHDPLRKAVIANDLDIVKFLVEHGADVHANNNRAVRRAAELGYLEIVKYLVSRGAYIRDCDDYAVVWATINDHSNVVEYLISQGANVCAQRNRAVRCAISNGYLAVVKLLVDTGAHINHGITLFLEASRYGYLDIIEYLAEKGFNFRPILNDMIMCAHNNKHYAIKVLLEIVRDAWKRSQDKI